MMSLSQGRCLPEAAALLAVALLCAAVCSCKSEQPAGESAGVARPPAGKLYHGVYPGGFSGEEDDITPDQVRSYEAAVGKRVAWVYFSHNWYRSTDFPRDTADWIRAAGSVPYIRLMLREEDNRVGDRFDVGSIIAGRLDPQLRRWAADARRFGTPLIVEYGTEANGEWFPWNGLHHGAGATRGFGDPAAPDGPERFVAAYRRIVDLMRAEGAHNITWVFHIDATDCPETSWNRFERYYPGDDYVDWIAVSAYGPQLPTDDEAQAFRDQMDPCYARIERLTQAKPVIIAEFGCTAGSPAAQPHQWAAAALDDILAPRWPRVIGFSWWNERWQNDDDPAHDTTMRVEEIPALARVFNQKLEAAKGKVAERPAFAPDSP